MPKRPLSVTILSWIYIAMGTVGFIYHLKELLASSRSEALLVEALRILAIVAGCFMLRGRDWARWLAIAWIALHVVVSFFHSWQQALMHTLFFLIITFLLTRSNANAFFKHNHA